MIYDPSQCIEQPTVGKRVGYNEAVFNGSAMYAAWMSPICQNAFYGQNAWIVGAVY